MSKEIIMSRVGLAKYFGALGRLQAYVSPDGKASRVVAFVFFVFAERRSLCYLQFSAPQPKQLTDHASQFTLTLEMRTFLSAFESTFQHALVAPAATSLLPSTLPDSTHPPSSSVDSAPSADAKRLQEAKATITALEK